MKKSQISNHFILIGSGPLKYNGFAPENVSNYQQQQKYKMITIFFCSMNGSKAEIQ